MTLKSCIGDRALGWDLLPPGSPRRTFSDASGNWTYAAYHETPHKWLTGSTPVGKSWVAGIQYDGDIYRANTVLGNLTTFYPGASCYEVAGFFWWQGDRDSRDMGDSTHYEANLVNLIKTLRVQYGSPNVREFRSLVSFIFPRVFLRVVDSMLTFSFLCRINWCDAVCPPPPPTHTHTKYRPNLLRHRLARRPKAIQAAAA